MKWAPWLRPKGSKKEQLSDGHVALLHRWDPLGLTAEERCRVLSSPEASRLALQILEALDKGSEAAWLQGRDPYRADVYVSNFGTFRLEWHYEEQE